MTAPGMSVAPVHDPGRGAEGAFDDRHHHRLACPRPARRPGPRGPPGRRRAPGRGTHVACRARGCLRAGRRRAGRGPPRAGPAAALSRRPTWPRCGPGPRCWRCAPAAAEARGVPQRRGSCSAEVAPELEEWAAFFASCSSTRAAAEAGISRRSGRRDADDLLRQAEQFVGGVTGRCRCAEGRTGRRAGGRRRRRRAPGRPLRSTRPSSEVNTAETSRAPGVSHRWMGRQAPCACCTAERSGRTPPSTSGPNSSRSSAIRNSCSALRGRTRLIRTPSGCRSRVDRSRSVCTASNARCTPDTANIVGSATRTARSAAASALRVSWPSDGGQSTITRR